MKTLYTGVDDPQLSQPYFDADEWRELPLRHRYVHGGFQGTQARFCLYFPEHANYQNRFYHFISPFVGDETEAQTQTGMEDKIGFSLSHGAYFIETNHGGIVNGGNDHTLVIRVNAAVAQLSRKIAAQMYGEHHPYGYIYGGSGGAFKTISCVENTTGVWDGAVPFVIGSPMAMPYVFTARVHAMRILRHKMAQIVDALEPGGSGDPYADLNKEEREALREVSLMGFPMKTWCCWDTIGEGALPVLTPAIGYGDPEYYHDFWEKPGYLGTAPGSSARRDRLVLHTAVTEVLQPQQLKTISGTLDEGNAYGVDEAWKHLLNKPEMMLLFRLEDFPKGDLYLQGLKLEFLSGKLSGQKFSALWVRDNIITVDNSMDPRDLKSLLSQAEAGDLVCLDNSDYIALQTYHRHQIPGPDYKAWDQFRDCGYPQRRIIGPGISISGAGSLQDGTAACKMIVLESLMDESAFPWQADWYRRQVEANCEGNPDGKFRLWYMDHCMHTDCEAGNGGDHQHIVSYLGALYQALLDISDWVEREKAPMPTSEYSLDGGQVLVPKTAQERKGIQSVVTLTADGSKKTCVKVGQPVQFTAAAELQPGFNLEQTTWDFERTDNFAQVDAEVGPDGNRILIRCSHTFSKPGTYFPVVRIAANRNPGDPFTQVMNMDRVRVVVE